jgi:hypothetical protein
MRWSVKVALATALMCICVLCAPNLLAATPKFDFDCDTPSGHYSHWKAAHSADGVRIRGTIKVLELRKEGEWVPGAHVYVYGAGGKTLMGLILGMDIADPTKIGASVLGPASRQSREAFASVVWKDASIAFEVDLGSSGNLRFSVDGNAQTVGVPGFVPVAVGLRCTSGNFFFNEVEIAP